MFHRVQQFFSRGDGDHVDEGMMIVERRRSNINKATWHCHTDSDHPYASRQPCIHGAWLLYKAPSPLHFSLPFPHHRSRNEMPVSDAILTQILTQLDAMQVSQQVMQAKVNISPSPMPRAC